MLFKLLSSPATAPVSGFRGLLEQFRQLAERELLDVDSIHHELLELQMLLEQGEITEEEYVAREAEIMPRLRAAKEYHQRGMWR